MTDTADTQATEHWWRNSVVYQVYIRSFADGNGDGTGDLDGLRTRLDYLRDLGIGAIWINPWYASPLHDGGYDVSDYREINPQFGDLEEAEQFVHEAHDRGMRVVADLVPNHTSEDHHWFQEALAAAPGSHARDRYIFRRGKGKDGAEPPTNWQSVFGGPAWTRIEDGDWYLHLFDPSQPDLNWENAVVRHEFESILRFWLDRGIDGFRVDVAHGLVKDLDFPDITEGRTLLLDSDRPVDHPHWDQDGVHQIIRSWRAILDEYDDRMMVAEAWVHSERLPLYLRPDEYHQAFNFELLSAEWNAKSFGEIIERSIDAAVEVGATTTWVLSNHDVMRHATRYGLPEGTDWRKWPATGPHDVLDADTGAKRARAAALITLSLPGSAYVYQGEELGLPEVWDLPAEVLDDPVWERSEHTEKGRDGCRVPIPWEPTGPSFGFGAGESWLPQPEWFGEFAAATQEGDPDSMLSLYREAISIRNDRIGDDERFEMLDLGKDVLAYRRADGIVVVANMGTKNVPMPEGDVLLTSSVEPLSGDLAPDTTAWLAE